MVDPGSDHVWWYKSLFKSMFDWNRYKGTFCSQDVAIKVLKTHLNEDMWREFSQEVYIMRFVIT